MNYYQNLISLNLESHTKTVKTEANNSTGLDGFCYSWHKLFLARIGLLYISAVYQIVDAGFKQVGYFIQNLQRYI